MKNKPVLFIAQAAVIAALYAVLTILQNALLPGSASMAVQFRVADKFAKSGLTAEKAETVDAPVIKEFPLCLECEFVEYQHNEYGCGVIGKVLSVTADERVMKDGKVDISAVNAIAFDPYTHGYYKVGERVGDAFKDGLQLK